MGRFVLYTVAQSIATTLSHPSRVITPARLGYTLTGTFIVAGATAAISPMNTPVAKSSQKENIVNADSTPLTTSVETTKQNKTEPANDSESTQVHTDVSTTTSDVSSSVNLQVNGQTIPIPRNGTVHQSISSNEGNSTQVTVTGNISVQGDTSNSSNSYMSLNVRSQSKTSGGVVSEDSK